MANVKQDYRCPKATFRKEVANLLEIEEDEVELIMDAFMCAMMNCLLVEGYDCVKVLPCLEVWKVSNVKGEEPRKIILNGKEITQGNTKSLVMPTIRFLKKMNSLKKIIS